MVRVYWQHARASVRYSLLTIAAMLALGFTTRYSGVDATLGLAFAHTGVLYPFFGTLLGWLGVALTGSRHVVERAVRQPAEDHGRAARADARADGRGEQLGRRDGQDDRRAVASSSRRPPRSTIGTSGEILRFVFFHSLALACLVGVLVMLQAYVWPFTSMVVSH